MALRRIKRRAFQPPTSVARMAAVVSARISRLVSRTLADALWSALPPTGPPPSAFADMAAERAVPAAMLGEKTLEAVRLFALVTSSVQLPRERLEGLAVRAIRQRVLAPAVQLEAASSIHATQTLGYPIIPTPSGAISLGGPPVEFRGREARAGPLSGVAPRLRTLVPEVPRNVNITISAEKAEEDLRDLERKISRILSDQIRRYYGSIRLEEA